MKNSRALQPDRDEVAGVPPSRTVVDTVRVVPPTSEPEGGFSCHLLSCRHLAPIVDMEMSRTTRRKPADGDYSKVKKRRCLACLEIDSTRPPVRTVLVPRR